jgi:hypothetical protein
VCDGYWSDHGSELTGISGSDTLSNSFVFPQLQLAPAKNPEKQILNYSNWKYVFDNLLHFASNVAFFHVFALFSNLKEKKKVCFYCVAQTGLAERRKREQAEIV